MIGADMLQPRQAFFADAVADELPVEVGVLRFEVPMITFRQTHDVAHICARYRGAARHKMLGSENEVPGIGATATCSGFRVVVQHATAIAQSWMLAFTPEVSVFPTIRSVEFE
jgi:hypothetical protein